MPDDAVPGDPPRHTDGAGVDPRSASTQRVPRVHPSVATAAAYAWRLLAIGLAVYAALWVIGQLIVVILPVAIAVLLVRALSPVATWLRRRLKPGLAALVAVLGFVLILGGVVTAVGTSLVGEFDELGSAITQGIDDFQRWLVEDGPFNLSEADVERWRERAGEALSRFVSSNQGRVASGAVIAAEVVVGAVLSIIVGYFFLKDGRRMTAGMLRALPATRRPVANRMARRSWDALGGYLRGAAVLGLVEAVAIGTALFAVGARLELPVMIVTFLAAFIPIVGAIFAGVVAVLVALVTAGGVPALIVAGVALVVQQLDNDLLAPMVYGRALRLHPLVILLGIAAGGSLFGFVGTFLAVPTLAVVLNSIDEFRRPSSDTTPAIPDAELATDRARPLGAEPA
jgi:putative heme transporter